MQSLRWLRFTMSLALALCLLAGALPPAAFAQEPPAPTGQADEPDPLDPTPAPEPLAATEVLPEALPEGPLGEPEPAAWGPEAPAEQPGLLGDTAAPEAHQDAEKAATPPQWHIERVDGGGMWPSIQIKPIVSGNPFGNRPVISYNTPSGDLRLAIKGATPADGCAGGASGWRCRTIDSQKGVFGPSDLAFAGNSSGNFGVIYANRGKNELTLRTFGNTGAQIASDTVSFIHPDHNPLVILPSLVYAGSTPLSAFHESSLHPLDHETWIGGLDYSNGPDSPSESVQSSERAPNDPVTVGYYASIDRAPNSSAGTWTPRIAYRGGAGVLRFAEFVGGTSQTSCPVWHNEDYQGAWRCITVDPYAVAYYISSYAPKPGVPNAATMIAYYDHVSRALKLARYVGGSGSCGLGGAQGWNCTAIDTIASGKNADNLTVSLAVDKDTGRISIAYVDKDDRGNSIIKLARPAFPSNNGNCGGGAWNCFIVDNGGPNNHNLMHAGLALEASGRAQIAYYDASSQSLFLASEKVSAAPTITKSFEPASVSYGEISKITYTLRNQTGVLLTGLRFNDVLPWMQVRYSGGQLNIPYVFSNCNGFSRAITHGASGDTLAFEGMTLNNGGSCTITVDVIADKAGTLVDLTSALGSNEAANGSAATATLQVSRAAQTITFQPLSDRTLSGINIPVLLSATSTSGLKVTFATSTPAICNVQEGVSGFSVTLAGGVGLCTVTASQAGDANHLPAQPVAQSFNVLERPKQDQVINFDPPPDKLVTDPPFMLSASSSSALVVSFVSDTPEVCTVSGATATLVKAGTCTIVALQGGSSAYNAAAATRSFQVKKLPQSISFAPLPDRLTTDAPFPVSATASSGLPVSFAASGACVVDGATVTVSPEAGSCTITASQSGSATYAAANAVSRSFAVNSPARQNQAITFAALPHRTAGDAPFPVSAAASSGLPVAFAASGACSVQGNMVSVTDVAGVCAITATQEGSDAFNPAAAVTQSFEVRKRAQSISFAPLPDRLTTDAPFPVSATASSGLPVTLAASGQCSLNGALLTLTGQAGSCIVTATQAGDDGYAAAPPVARGFAINDPAKAPQSIGFAPLPDRLTTDAPFPVSATASSGLPVTFTADGVCAVSGAVVTLSGAEGSCTITAHQPGSGQYNAAAPVAHTFSARLTGESGNTTGGFVIFLPISTR
jgi:hypothetical protein